MKMRTHVDSPGYVSIHVPMFMYGYESCGNVLNCLTVASSFFLLIVASPIGIFLPRYLELGTGPPFQKRVISGSLPVKLPVKISGNEK